MSSHAADADRESLLAEFRNVSDVFGEAVLAKPDRFTFHRPDHETDPTRPACGASSASDDFQLVAPEEVRDAGFEPCRGCYRAIFEYLAANPASPVEPRAPSLDRDDLPAEPTDEFEPIRPDSKPTPLSVLTEEVLVTSGSSVMHAPTRDGPLCNQNGEYRRVEPSLFAGQYRPCQRCFDVASD